MKRPPIDAVLRAMYILQLSDYTAIGFYTNLVDSDEPEVLWQAAVDTLYRLAVSDLIWSPSLSAPETIVSFVEELARTFPYPPGDIADAWVNVDILPTKRCSEIVWAETEDPRAWTPSARSKELLDMEFAKFGVPFDVYPVIVVPGDSWR